MIQDYASRLTLALLLAAVASNAELTPVADPEPAAKLSAPITFRYEILGNPIVGQPIAITLIVSSSQPDTVTVAYRIVDASSMIFPESQALKVELSPSSDGTPARQQITVVPQREGRLYLNVSGSIETPDGTVIRAAAIPIQVGSSRREQAVNGEALRKSTGKSDTPTTREAN